MLEAETEIVLNEADNDTLNKNQKHKKKKQLISGGKLTWKKLNNLQLLVTMESQKMII